MNWLTQILNELHEAESWGYNPGEAPAAEPTAWAALVLAARGRDEAARRAAANLVAMQNKNGSVGIDPLQRDPNWPTPLAILAWETVNRRAGGDFQGAIDRAIPWLLEDRGDSVDQPEYLAHNTRLVGWSWVAGTHSWYEPTAHAVMALRSQRLGQHERTREAVRLLIDRLLPDGGANYGNTFVLGQKLRAHLEPSGLALLALRMEPDNDGRIQRTADWVANNVGASTTSASLGYALQGLAAWDRWPQDADAWMDQASQRTRQRPSSVPRLALLAQAALHEESPLVQFAREGVLK